MLTGEQIRGARAMLGWSQSELAKRANLGFATVQRAERSSGRVSGMIETVVRLQQALEDGGVIFIDADDEAGPGVRMRATGALTRR
ncbi:MULTISPECIES: helix-turn-helix transcriptional regulator [unclassified Roseitalea]|uniref:helix-turn-helix domain-containing protein n=1 Tax=unclassified Roseitalea TaxID=2639107 RepID=UPI00273D53D1|nr:MULTISPECIES: helix-turn-helix transcriptional regulator [unclassified Roseitalea]